MGKQVVVSSLKCDNCSVDLMGVSNDIRKGSFRIRRILPILGIGWMVEKTGQKKGAHLEVEEGRLYAVRNGKRYEVSLAKFTNLGGKPFPMDDLKLSSNDGKWDVY